MAKATVTVGSRIYYTGDMANIDGVGTVIKIIPASNYAPEMAVVHLDDGRDCTPATMSIEDEYKGHCGVRFVTEEAYQSWREAKLEEMKQAVAKLMA